MQDFSIWFLTLSDLLVNLAAGWFGVALIIPITGRLPKRLNLWLLTYNISFGTLSVFVAVLLRQGIRLMKNKLNLADINVKVGIGYALILIIILLLYIAFTK